jgi:hypothetical protein
MYTIYVLFWFGSLTLPDPIPVIVYTDGLRIKTLTIAYKYIEYDSWLTLLPLRRS